MIYCGYIKLATLEFPKYMHDILYDHPDLEYSSVEFGEFPHPPTYALVRSTPMPDHDQNTHRVETAPPVLQDGEWYQSWTVVPWTEQELASRAAFLAEMQAHITAAQEEQAAVEAARPTVASTETTVTFI